MTPGRARGGGGARPRPPAHDEGTLLRRRPAAYRVAAVEALASARTPEAVEALRELLRDKEREVCGAALWAVSERGRR